MKRIAIINSIYPYTSTGRICQEMSNFLSLKGYSVACFYGEGKESESTNYKFNFKVSKTINAIKTRLNDSAGLNSSFATKRLLKKLNDFKPDLLIVHNLHAYYLNIKMFLKYVSENKIPIVFVLHDCWNFTGHCTHFELIGCEKWKKACERCPQIDAYPRSIFLDRSKRNFRIKKELFENIKQKVFVTPSNWLKNIVKESFLGNNPIYTINNGIDTSVFKKQLVKKNSDKFTILCVANVWDKKKGIDDVIHLSNIIDNNYEIVLVGKLKHKYDFGPNITYVSHTNNTKELAEIYSKSDVFFNPTYEDNYPTVNLEALSCKCPVVCYKTGGAYEMLDSKYVVKKGDIKKAADIMKDICEKGGYLFPDLNAFSKDVQYEKYYQIIKGLLEE